MNGGTSSAGKNKSNVRECSAERSMFLVFFKKKIYNFLLFINFSLSFLSLFFIFLSLYSLVLFCKYYFVLPFFLFILFLFRYYRFYILVVEMLINAIIYLSIYFSLYFLHFYSQKSFAYLYVFKPVSYYAYSRLIMN